VTAIYSCWKIS